MFILQISAIKGKADELFYLDFLYQMMMMIDVFTATFVHKVG